MNPKNNKVTYTWGVNQWNTCCWEYPSSITYNEFPVTFFWERRPDVKTRANGISFASYYGRIKTIDISVGNTRVRTYSLWYTTSGGTGRSMLTNVQQYGKDATFDVNMTVTGGSSTPALTYSRTGTPNILQTQHLLGNKYLR